VWTYVPYGICDPKGTDIAVFFSREESYRGSKSLKIVDYYGDLQLIEKIAYALDEMLNKNSYEFVDVYSYGVDNSLYEKAGMVRCDSDSVNIIPQYFQPYLRKNIDIAFSPPNLPKIRVFRGDSGIDRPRFVHIEGKADKKGFL
jgi:hypothetical protein